MELLYNGILVLFLPREPGIKGLRLSEYIGQQEVEQCPQLVQVVLQGSTCDEQSVPRAEKTDDLGERRLFVLDSMRLQESDALSGNRCKSHTSSTMMYSQANFFR